VFAREIDDHQLNASNFLGLAVIRLASGDTVGALDLLRRLVVVVGNPFENLDPAAALLEKNGHRAEAIEFLDQLVKSTPWDPMYRARLAKARLATGKDTPVSRELLASLASASNVPYELRVDSARSLGPSGASANLGSGELNLLARFGADIPPADADKFYYYEARIAAAQTVVDPQTKVQLLSHCIIDFPRRNEARIPLFQATSGARSDEFAIGILKPLLSAQFLGRVARYTPESEDEQIAASQDEEAGDEDAAGPAAPSLKLSRAQQSQMAQLVAETMERLARLSDAVFYFEIGRRTETSDLNRRQLAHKIATLKATLRIEHQNAARQPILHEALEQDRIVRPRVFAHATPPTKTAITKGAVKR